VGVDLAAEATNTAIAVIEWRSPGARVVAAELPGGDDAVLRHTQDADKVGIDCPLGWPDTFVEFLNTHHEHRLHFPEEMPSAIWRRSLAYRGTDEHVRHDLGIIPLSVAADRIGITAMRAVRLQGLLAPQGHTIDRAGSGLIVEVYPAAGLKRWNLPHRSY
jgi:predicted nuclease with RNAse H fold